MATRKFLITFVAYIALLFDSAGLGYKLILIFFNAYLFFESKQGRDFGGVGGETEDTKQFCANSREPDAGLKLMTLEIITWAQVGHSTNWATQVPRAKSS